MRKWFAIVTLLGILFTSSSVRAQGDLRFTSVDVSLWPEYDSPDVLVIYKMILSPSVTLPVQVTLRVPTRVTKPHVVAVGQTLATVSDQNVGYSFQTGTEWSEISITATGPAIQAEYYDPNLSKEGQSRHFVYEWRGDFLVDTFRFELREPLRSTDVKTEPPLNDVGSDSAGFHYGEFVINGLPAGENFTVTIDYQRDTDSPSVSFLQVQPSGPLGQNTAGRISLTTYLPWILGGLGVLLIAGGGLYYWQSGRSSGLRPRKRHAPRRAEDEETGTGQVYCYQCGKRAQPGDRFCRACGTRLRREQ